MFHAGDRLYARRRKRLVFNGGAGEWRDWLGSVLTAAQPDRIVLFGCERAIHAVAREEAAARGIEVLSLEEGYVRPGYITAERGGNNWLSPLAGRLPPEDFRAGEEPAERRDFRGFGAMCRHGALYYTARGLFTGLAQRELFHRRLDLLAELVVWPRNLYRRMAGSMRAFATLQHLLEHHDGGYTLVPLQVAGDAQLGRAALGWTNQRLIVEVLRSFAAAAPAGQRLVFKIHPLERGRSRDRELILQTARLLGIAERVEVIDNGSLGLLTRHAARVITINSTSGLSAIFHGVPLLVVGEALYAHPVLATCAHGQPDFDAFWRSRHVAAAALRRRYLAWVRSRCLLPGDFYSRDGIRTACHSLLEVLRARESATPAAQPRPVQERLA